MSNSTTTTKQPPRRATGDANGGTPLAEPTGSAFEHGMVTWECNECQQIGATYCCRISVDIGHGDNHALVCPQRCPWFDWCESDWYRVSKPNKEVDRDE